MTLYANINKQSKYFKSQSAQEPFMVALIETSDHYCWEGNFNKYRTSDLDFYVKHNGTFFPSGILDCSTAMLERTLQFHLDYIKDLFESSSLNMQEILFEERVSTVTTMMKEILYMLPEIRQK